MPLVIRVNIAEGANSCDKNDMQISINVSK